MQCSNKLSQSCRTSSHERIAMAHSPRGLRRPSPSPRRCHCSKFACAYRAATSPAIQQMASASRADGDEPMRASARHWYRAVDGGHRWGRGMEGGKEWQWENKQEGGGRSREGRERRGGGKTQLLFVIHQDLLRICFHFRASTRSARLADAASRMPFLLSYDYTTASAQTMGAKPCLSSLRLHLLSCTALPSAMKEIWEEGSGLKDGRGEKSSDEKKERRGCREKERTRAAEERKEYSETKAKSRCARRC